MDLKIASIAMANEAILVSRNIKDARTSAGFNGSGSGAMILAF
jgi:predicted nucleic acid-binding protein